MVFKRFESHIADLLQKYLCVIHRQCNVSGNQANKDVAGERDRLCSLLPFLKELKSEYIFLSVFNTFTHCVSIGRSSVWQGSMRGLVIHFEQTIEFAPRRKKLFEPEEGSTLGSASG